MKDAVALPHSTFLITYCNTDAHLHRLPIKPKEICFSSKLDVSHKICEKNKKTFTPIGQSLKMTTSNSLLVSFQEKQRLFLSQLWAHHWETVMQP